MLDNIDVIIVGIYLAISLFIGFYHRHSKDFREFAVAKKNYPTAILVATIFATGVGSAAVLGASQQFYKRHGLPDD